MRTITRYRIALVREDDTAVPPRANLNTPRGVFRFMQEFLAEADREELVALVSTPGATSSATTSSPWIRQCLHRSPARKCSRRRFSSTRAIAEAGRMLDMPLHDHVPLISDLGPRAIVGSSLPSYQMLDKHRTLCLRSVWVQSYTFWGFLRTP